MSRDGSTPLEEQLAAWLLAYDQALASGATPPDLPGAGAPPAAGPELERDLACLRRLRRALARPGAGAAAPPDGLPPGSLGRFQIRGELGRGTFGVVWLAYDPRLGREVALKVPRPEALVTPQLRQRFVREAQAAAGLDHPHVVPVYEAGEADSVCYIASAYCPGVTLAAWLKGRAEPVPVRAAAALVATLAGAVDHAHRRGVVHRDLKPGNVLLQPGPRPAAPGPESALPGPDAEQVYVPRVTDFGLAKLLAAPGGGPGGDGGEPTRSGVIVGTPAYMAPEQASGKNQGVGPAADVYALGVILYELLVGRPPFVGETDLDTLEQVRSQEPVPPRRLRPRLPRDLETICLKCLQKEPARRYGTARALAEDLGRFQAGAAIRARPVGRLERLLKWVRRKPTAAALWGLSLAAVLVGAGGGLGWAWQQAEQARAVQADLGQVADLVQAGRLAEARAALGRAEGRVAGRGPPDLVRRVNQMRDDLTLVDALDRIRYASADRDYAALFRERGLAAEGEDATVVGARIEGSAVRAQLVAALDDWAVATADPGRRAWLLEVARRADPGAWGDSFRDPAVWGQRAALEQLARQAKVTELSPQLLTALAGALRRAGADAVPLLTAAQALHPEDFWLNYLLGNALADAKRVEEAVGYYRAALAVRPGTAAVYNNLGIALWGQGRPGDAIQAYHQVMALDPAYAPAHNNLGLALRDKGLLDDAIQAYRRAIALDAKYARAHSNLGIALSEKGRLDDAIQAYRQAIALDPNEFLAHNNLGAALERKGRLDDAIRAYRTAIAINPTYVRTHTNLGAALTDKGLLDDAIRAYRTAIALDPKDASAHNNLGAALWTQGRLDDAIQEYRQAVALNPKYALAHYNLGKALSDQGRLDDAIQEYRQAIRLAPKDVRAHNNLGNALKDQGRLDDAIQEYRQAIRLAPKDARAHSNLGNALKDQGRLDEAIREHRKAIALDPNDPRAHTNLGLVLQDKGRLDQAIREHRRAIALDPKLAQAHSNLGNALRALGRPDDAIREYRRAIALDPEDVKTHSNLGTALVAQGLLDEAIQEYSQAIKLAPNEPKLHVNLGIALQNKGRLDEAIREYHRAIKLAPKLAQAHSSLGSVLVAKGQPDDAVRACREAIALDPKYALARLNLGNALHAQGRLDGAIQAFRQAIEVDPKFAPAHYNLGATLRDQGRLDDAIQAYRQAIATDPGLAPAHKALGQALLQNGQFVEAQTATRRCLALLAPNHPLRQPVAQQLQQCERFLELSKRLPAVLQGQAQPGGTAERLALAQFCQSSQQRYTAAARFYAEAFAQQPQLADDLRSQRRYNAACAAARAAAGQGIDAASLDDKERARLRQQALGWLRADLAAWTELLEAGQPDARARVRQTFQHWQRDSDLACLRAAAAVANLPSGERQACQKLWADVEALLQRAQGKAP
jgi:tetratricopeptide (TPR) repeat protein